LQPSISSSPKPALLISSAMSNPPTFITGTTLVDQHPPAVRVPASPSSTRPHDERQPRRPAPTSSTCTRVALRESIPVLAEEPQVHSPRVLDLIGPTLQPSISSSPKPALLISSAMSNPPTFITGTTLVDQHPPAVRVPASPSSTRPHDERQPRRPSPTSSSAPARRAPRVDTYPGRTNLRTTAHEHQT
jgi:hypothetical protein